MEFEEEVATWWQTWFSTRNFCLAWAGFFVLLMWIYYGSPELFELTNKIAQMPSTAWLFPPLLLLITAATRKAGRMAILVASAVLLLTVLFIVRPYFPFGRDSADGNFRVVTLNIQEGDAGAVNVASVIKRRKADVFCIQGMYDFGLKLSIERELRAQFKNYRLVTTGDSLIGTRYPIVGKDFVELPGLHERRSLLRVDLNVKGQRISVYNVNLIPSDGDPPMDLDGRRKLYEAVLSAIPQEGDNILAGSFYTNPNGLFYRQFGSRFTDAFADSGLGMGYTSSAKMPLKRTDYIWFSGKLRCEHSAVANERASSNLAVLADFNIASLRKKKSTIFSDGGFPAPKPTSTPRPRSSRSKP